MNHKKQARLLPVFLAAIVLAFTATACQSKKPPVEEEAIRTDRVAPSPVGTAQNILHKTFTVKSSANFPFEIPPHAVRPHLHGIFESFVRELHGASDDSADVDFFIVTADQFADLSSDRPSETLFSVEASHNQSVNLDLPPSADKSIKYYLVFRNSANKGPTKVVEADFHVDF